MTRINVAEEGFMMDLLNTVIKKISGSTKTHGRGFRLGDVAFAERRYLRGCMVGGGYQTR